MNRFKNMPDISPSEYHGMLSFETSERYATVTVSFKTRTLTVRGGDIRGDKHPAGSYSAVDLSPPQAAGHVMRALGVDHHEDHWADIHDTVHSFRIRRLRDKQW